MKIAAAAMALLILGLGSAIAYVRSRTEVYVFAPATAEATVALDGERPVVISAGAQRIFRVGEGAHTLRQSGGADLAFTVAAGTDRLVVPSSSEQCFWVLDISRSNYGMSRGVELPVVKATHREPFSAGGPYLPWDQLPTDGVPNGPIDLVRAVPCAELTRPEREVLTSVLGYRERPPADQPESP